MKMLFVTTRRDRPSFRFRVVSLLPFFQSNGHNCHTALLPRNLLNRYRFYRRLKNYDVVLFQQRLLSRIELAWVRRYAVTLVYDVDDAVMFGSGGNRDSRRRKRFDAMSRTADLVICGNEYLFEKAQRSAARAVVIPTCVDTNLFHPRLRPAASPHSDEQRLTVGWTGSTSTNAYLNSLFPVLAQLGRNVGVKVISDSTDGLDLERLGSVPFQFVRWSPEREAAETATFDIGVMPLPDNRWTRGKCGCKVLQYMALGIPAVCDPVGVNREIVQHGQSGCFADSPESWLGVLRELLGNQEKRESLGRAGRERAEQAYCLTLGGPLMVAEIETVVSNLTGRAA
jgi:hypothetical protein